MDIKIMLLYMLQQTRARILQQVQHLQADPQYLLAMFGFAAGCCDDSSAPVTLKATHAATWMQMCENAASDITAHELKALCSAVVRVWHLHDAFESSVWVQIPAHELHLHNFPQPHKFPHQILG